MGKQQTKKNNIKKCLDTFSGERIKVLASGGFPFSMIVKAPILQETKFHKSTRITGPKLSLDAITRAANISSEESYDTLDDIIYGGANLKKQNDFEDNNRYIAAIDSLCDNFSDCKDNNDNEISDEEVRNDINTIVSKFNNS